MSPLNLGSLGLNGIIMTTPTVLGTQCTCEVDPAVLANELDEDHDPFAPPMGDVTLDSDVAQWIHCYFFENLVRACQLNAH